MPAPARHNRTLTCSPDEIRAFSDTLLRLDKPVDRQAIDCQLIEGDFFDTAAYLPTQFIDVLILDPPYNLTKHFHGNAFYQLDKADYQSWFARMLERLMPMLKPHATAYVCSDWKTSTLIFPILEKHFFIQNRITWEREKGRGAKRNWKNNTEDIWFCTLSDQYSFNVDAVKMKRKVLAPYRMNGTPKDWQQERHGNYRLTHPSNIWTDITVPFWSMPENTPHPTQKPEKLFAKLILASSQKGDWVFDPFVGSGTSVVVAEKLGRRWCGIDNHTEYLCWAKKRLDAAQNNTTIQGYHDNIFWERNSLPESYATSSLKTSVIS